MTLNESMIAIIVVVMAMLVIWGAVFNMYLTTGTLARLSERIATLEASNKELRKVADEWSRFKEANGIDEDGSAHPWRISVFHTPKRRTA